MNIKKIGKYLFLPKVCMHIGIWVNVALTIFKFIAGIMGLSKAMLADALHSFSDILATSIAYIGITIGARPEDEEHPYGHGNAETIAASLISLFIVGIGFWVGISAFLVIMQGKLTQPLNIALIAAAVSIVVKEWLFRYTIKVGEQTNNPAVIADAWHHRSDAYSSIGTFIGIGLAKLSFLYFDPIAALVVSIFIVKIGVELVRSNIRIIMDERPHSTFMNNIKTVVQKVAEVKKIDNIKVHRRGSAFTVDLEIAVDGKISVEEGHKIAAEVRNRLLKNVQHIRDVMVHVNPFRVKG